MGWSGDKKKQNSGGGWTGKKQGGKASSQYAWQEKPRNRTSPGKPTQRRYESKWALFSVLGVGLLAIFVWTVLHTKPRTPILLVTGLDYTAPTPPNSWALEDHQALTALDKTLDVAETEAGPSRLSKFQKWISDNNREHRGIIRIKEPLIIYFRMPGVVDENGDPHLLTPEASPLSENDDWWSVEAILEQVENLPADRTKLLIFDSNQHLVDWRMGLVYNTFQDRLAGLLKDTSIPNLAVITAAGPGQKCWSSAELGGSAFGQFLQLGLAGEADRVSEDPDNNVSLQELVSYLQQEVGSWVQFNRGAVQEPALLPAGSKLDFFVTHSVGNGKLEELRDAMEKPGDHEPSIDVDTITGLWQSLAELSEVDIVRYDPLALGNFQNRLLRLEQLAYGGAGCEAEAADVAEALQKDLLKAVKRKLAAEGSAALADQWGVVDSGNADRARKAGLASLPLREYFGQSQPTDSKRVQALWKLLIDTTGKPGPVDTDAIREISNSDVELTETQFLVSAHRQGALNPGKSKSDLTNLLALSQRAQGLAVPRSQQGKPGDERAHYYVRKQLEDAEPKRRKAEDLLFIAEADSGTIGERVRQANNSYAEAERIRDGATDSLKVVDRAWAEVGPLAEWLCQPNGDGSFRFNDENELGKLLASIRMHQSLGKQLGGLQRIRSRDVDPKLLKEEISVLVSEADQIASVLDALNERFSSSYKVLGAAEDGSEVATIEAVLACPLVTASPGKGEMGRQELLISRDRLAKKLHEEHFGGSGIPQQKESTEESEAATEEDLQGSGETQGVDEVINGWRTSPLLAVLDLPMPSIKGDVDATNRLDKINAAVREGLVEASQFVSSVEDLPVGQEDEDYWQDRAALSRAERRARVAAPFLTTLPKENAIADLRRFDLQQLMLWHTQRTLDDFWHRVTRNNPKTVEDLRSPKLNFTSDRDERLFESIASEYLDIAEKMRPAFPPGVGRQLETLKLLMEQRQQASLHGMTFQTKPEPILGAEGQFHLEITALPHSQGSNLPPGLAAVYVADLDNHRLRSAPSGGGEWGRLELPLVDRVEGGPAKLEAEISGGKKSEVYAVSFFRGQQYRQRFLAPDPQIAQVEYDWPDWDRQSVTLLGDEAKPPSVIFILDCSKSMETIVDGETLTESGNRLDEAINALDAMLRQLAKMRGAQVGVRFFGHRLYWTKPFNRANPYDEYLPAGVPAPPRNMSPGEDIEEVLTLGDFGGTELGYISDRLDQLKPHGYTPVYLSIRRALDSFPDDDDQHNKSIIVITDGANYQPYIAGFPKIEPSESTIDHVIEQWADKTRKRSKGDPIPIHIIGFGVPEQATEAVQEFTKIAEKTGGDYLPTSSGGELLRKLQERLDVNGYSVVGPQGESLTGESSSGGPGKKSLNTEIEVPKEKFPPPVEVQVLFEELSKPVFFEGGEELQIQLGRNAFEYVPYLDEAINEQQLIQGVGGRDTSHWLRVHQPERKFGNVTFRFSVQDKDSYFTYRPQMVWAEVSPKDSDLKYVFYDRVFQPGKPAPLVRFAVSNWPEKIRQARVNFWCSYEEPISTGAIELSSVLGKNMATMSFQSTQANSKVGAILAKESGGQFSVFVEERHDNKPAAIDALRVWLDISDASLHPTSVSHLFEANQGVVRHRFLFANDGMSDLDFAKKITVRYASGQELKKTALQMKNPDGLEVEISTGEAIHEPTSLGF